MRWSHALEAQQQAHSNRKEYSLKVKYLNKLEPKANKCFSILGIKSFKGQKTFNVECDKEEDCIKYVDYISIIIQNFKAQKEV
jgi:hypothetical protein